MGSADVRMIGIESASGYQLLQSAEELRLAVDASREAGLLEDSAHDLVNRAPLFPDLGAQHSDDDRRAHHSGAGRGGGTAQVRGMTAVPRGSIVGPPSRPADPDSRARTHLANERTFLAWLRTGLSLVAVGLAAAGFLPIDLVPGFPYVRSFSVLLVLSGTMMVLYGANRYVKASRQIETGSYDPAIMAIVTIAAIISVLGIMAIPLVLLLR